jgi:radical SAM superfamily enzyme YgiQ (UPF0313 family)
LSNSLPPGKSHFTPMNVLLISANTETINMPVLPLGLAFVNAALMNRGYQTLIINLMAAEDAEAILETAISDFEPDVIGVSVRNIDTQDIKNPVFMLDPVKAIIARCRALSSAPVVIGGAGYSIYPEAALAYTGADMGIQGEGEAAFPELLQRIAIGRPLSDVPGLYRPGKGSISPRQCIRRTSDIIFPRPGIHLPVPNAARNEHLWIPFQTRRGCPLNCSYCSTSAIEGRIVRKLPLTRAAEALAAWKGAGFSRFFFTDNTFNLPPAYAAALCDEIISRNLDIEWRCILYPSAISEPLIAKMAEAGCREVSLGFESGCDEILKQFNKHFTTADICRTSALLKKYRIAQMGFLMLGGPGETRETVQRSLDFIDRLAPDTLKITTGIRIYPNTRLAEIARHEGVIRADDTLLMPRFYIREELKDWLMQTIDDWTRNRDNCFF